MVVSGAVSPPQAASSSSEPHSIPTVRITSGLPFAGSSGGRHGTALATPLSETTDGQSATNGELISADGASTLLNGNGAFVDELPDALGDPDADLHPNKTGAMHFGEGTARNRQSLVSSVAELGPSLPGSAGPR